MDNDKPTSCFNDKSYQLINDKDIFVNITADQLHNFHKFIDDPIEHICDIKFNMVTVIGSDDVKCISIGARRPFQLNEFFDEHMLLTIVSAYPYAIRYIDDPSENVKLRAINNDPKSIRYMTDPSEKLQLAAIEDNPDVIEFITDPTQNTQLAAIIRNCTLIARISSPAKYVFAVACKINYLENKLRQFTDEKF